MKIILPKSKILAAFLLFAVFLFGSTAFGQTTGDYRSNGSGSWTDRLIWEYYTGTSWVTPSGTSPQGYPGQYSGTGTVTIRNSHDITVGANIPNNFTALVIGEGTSGKLSVSSDSTLRTTSVTINSNAVMSFGQNIKITFLANASIVINSPGKLDKTNCSNNNAIYLGTVKYSACAGNNGSTTFDQLNNSGGTGSATSNSPVCTGNQLILTANAPVATSGSYTYTYKWSGNGIYSPDYNSSATYTINIANVNNHGGTYSVDIKRNDGIITTVTTDVVINPTPVGGGVYNGNAQICLNSSTGNMTLGGGYVGNVVRWEKRLNSGFWTSISNTSTVYSENPSVAGTWDYRAVVGSGSCPVVYSTPFNVVVNPELTISLVSNNSAACSSNTNSSLSYTATTGNASAIKIDFDNAAYTAGVQDIDYQSVAASGGSGTITIQYAYGTASGVYNGILTVIKDFPACTSSITYPITLTISSSTTPITISTHPTDKVICVGGNTSFSVVGSAGVFSYQWQVSTNGGVGYSNLSNGGVYSNVTTATMNITAATAGMANYMYRCIVNGCAGAVNSNGATLVLVR